VTGCLTVHWCGEGVDCLSSGRGFAAAGQLAGCLVGAGRLRSYQAAAGAGAWSIGRCVQRLVRGNTGGLAVVARGRVQNGALRVWLSWVGQG
jgi:hypothetical protein